MSDKSRRTPISRERRKRKLSVAEYESSESSGEPVISPKRKKKTRRKSGSYEPEEGAVSSLLAETEGETIGTGGTGNSHLNNKVERNITVRTPDGSMTNVTIETDDLKFFSSFVCYATAGANDLKIYVCKSV